MLFALAAILFLVWILGLAFKVTGGVIHLALIAAVIFFVIGLFRGRTTRTV
jgi:hypothetical protein